MSKSLFRFAAVTLLGCASLLTAAEPGQRAVGMSVQTTEALTGAAKSEQLRGHLATFDTLKKLAFAGQFSQAKELAGRAAHAVEDQPVTEADTLSRTLLTAMLMGYEAEFTALTGDIAGGKAELMRVERLDVPDDVKAMARAQQGYLDMLELNLGSAVVNEQRGARGNSVRGGGVQPVLQAARGIYEGNPGGSLAQLSNLAGVGATGAQATLYAGLAALADGRLAEATQWLQRAQPDTGYLPSYFIGTGLVAAAQGDFARAKVAFDAGASREFGPLLRAKFLSEVASMALGGAANLQPLVSHVPANYQRIGADLMAAPSAAIAAAALKNPGSWWVLNGYAPGTLAATVPSAPTPSAGPALNPATGLPEPTGPAPLMPAVPEGDTRPATAPGEPAGPAPAEPAKATGGGGGGAPQGGTEATDKSKEVDQRADSSQAVLAFNAAMGHLQAGRRGMAESALRNSVKLWPGFGEGWLALGSLLQSKGDPTSVVEATNSYGHAAGLHPEWPEPLFGLAQAWELRGNTEVARTYYQEALRRGLGGEAGRVAAERLK